MAPDQPAASATRFCHLGINFRPVNYGKNIKNLNRIVPEVQGVFTRFKKGHPRPLFHLFLVFSKKQYKRVFTCRLSIVNFVINHINSIKYSIVWMPEATQNMLNNRSNLFKESLLPLLDCPYSISASILRLYKER